MKDLLDDLNYNIITENLLEDESNIEMLEEAIANWVELIAQIHREQESEAQMARRWELDEDDLLGVV